MRDRAPRPGIARRLDTDEDRRFWRAVDEAAREVETYPAWKRGVSILDERAEAREETER